MSENYAGTGIGGFSGDGGDSLSAMVNIDSTSGGVWVDTSQTLFVVDLKNNRIRSVDSGTKIITTIAGRCSLFSLVVK